MIGVLRSSARGVSLHVRGGKGLLVVVGLQGLLGREMRTGLSFVSSVALVDSEPACFVEFFDVAEDFLHFFLNAFPALVVSCDEA